MAMNDLSSLQSQNKQLKEKNSILEAELQNKSRRLAKLQNDANSTQKQYEDLLSRIIELQQNEKDLLLQVKESETTKQKYKQLLILFQQKEKSLKEKDQQMMHLKEEFESSQKLIEFKDIEIAELKSQLQNYQIDIANLKESEISLHERLSKQTDVSTESLSKIQALEALNQQFKNQLESLQIINEKLKFDNDVKESQIQSQKNQIEQIQAKRDELQSVLTNATSLLTKNTADFDPSQFISILSIKLSKPKLYSIATQSETQRLNDSDSYSFNDSESFHSKKYKSKRLATDVLSQFNQGNDFDSYSSRKSEVARKIGQIKDQFQTDFSLQNIIDMHNKLWKEENQQQVIYSRKNIRYS